MIEINFVFCAFLAVFIKSGLAIQCYMCDSSTTAECHKMEPGNSVRLETCTPQKIGQDAAPWLRDFLKIDYYYDGNTLKVPMMCQKIVAFNEQNEKTTYRGCQLNASQTNPCTVMINKAKINPSFKINNCEVCEKDYCNGSSGLALFAPLFVLIGYALIKNSIL